MAPITGPPVNNVLTFRKKYSKPPFSSPEATPTKSFSGPTAGSSSRRTPISGSTPKLTHLQSCSFGSAPEQALLGSSPESTFPCPPSSNLTPLTVADTRHVKLRFRLSAILGVFALAAFIIQGLAIWAFQRLWLTGRAEKVEEFDVVWILPWISWGLFHGALVAAAIWCVWGLRRESGRLEEALELRETRGKKAGKRGSESLEMNVLEPSVFGHSGDGAVKGKGKRCISEEEEPGEGKGEGEERVLFERLQGERKEDWQTLGCHPTFLQEKNGRSASPRLNGKYHFGEGPSNGLRYHTKEQPGFTAERSMSRNGELEERRYEVGSEAGLRMQRMRPPRNGFDERRPAIRNPEGGRPQNVDPQNSSLVMEGDVFGLQMPRRIIKTGPRRFPSLRSPKHKRRSQAAELSDTAAKSNAAAPPPPPPRPPSRSGAITPTGEGLHFTGLPYPLMNPEKYAKKAPKAVYEAPAANSSRTSLLSPASPVPPPLADEVRVPRSVVLPPSGRTTATTKLLDRFPAPNTTNNSNNKSRSPPTPPRRSPFDRRFPLPPSGWGRPGGVGGRPALLTRQPMVGRGARRPRPRFGGRYPRSMDLDTVNETAPLTMRLELDESEFGGPIWKEGEEGDSF
ncbi:MAG: hypothetical protein LQ351_001850 [Letrouitia transgressa]|nr:MAG: hypothetical protein LQ351_001850 [Letrouitia transgressa]